MNANSSGNRSVLIFDPNFHRAAPGSHFMNEIDEVASHLASIRADQGIILDNYAVRHFYGVDLSMFDAVYESVKISPMPWWSTNGTEKGVVNVIPGPPFCPV
jgi:hypothetical protein